MSTYKVGAKIRSVVPEEPDPMAVVVDDDGLAWQNRPGPDDEQPWKSTAGDERSWTELVSAGDLRVVYLGGSQA